MIMKRTLKYTFLVSVVMWVAGIRVAGAAGAPAVAPKEPTVTMSPFEVGANSVDFKSWIKIGSPHYLLYTDANEKEAIQALIEMEKLQTVAQAFFQRRVINRPPIVVVLPTSRSDWRKIENKGGVEWKVAVSQPASRLVNLVLVEYDWQGRGLFTMRAAQGPAVVRAMNLRGTFWFEQGMGAFFETLEFDGNKVNLGRQNGRGLQVADGGAIEWGKFFHIDGRSREFTREDTVEKVVGQSAVFVHYLLSQPDAVWRDRLLDWNARLRSGAEPTEAEFKTIFGEDWKAWQKRMDDYLHGGKYQLRAMTMPKSAMEFPTSKVDLSLSEMRELFVIAQVLNQNVPASETALNSILQRGLKNENLRELLAEACFARGRMTEGTNQLDLLIAADSPNPEVYQTAGRRIFYEEVPKISIYGRFDAETVTKLRTLFRKALEIEPLCIDALDLLAWTEALGPTVNAENLAAIERIYHTLDGYAATSDAVAAMATAAWRSGDKAWALKIAQELAQSPYADKDGKRTSGELLKELGGATGP